MPLISAQGLYSGERINECSVMAQLYYPRLLCAANGHGRIHLNYFQIVAKAFTRWPDGKIPEESELMGYFEEYAEHRLLFTYQSGNQFWGVWDFKPGTFGKYQTKEDDSSPPPPEQEFKKWTEENRVNSSKPSIPITYKNAAKFRKGSEISPQVFSQTGDGVGVGVGVGEGIGEGVRCEVVGETPARAKEFNFHELAIIILTVLGLGHTTRPRLPAAAAEAIRIKSGESGLDPPTAAQEIAKVAVVYSKWAESQPKTKSWENWFADGEWRKPASTWEEGKNSGKSRLTTTQQSDIAIDAVFARRHEKGDEVGARHVPRTPPADS